MTLSLINGLLKPSLAESVNCINALDVAKGRSIDVSEVKSSKEEEYVNCIKVEVETDKDPFTVWGALSGNQEPRIVKVNEVYMEAIPDGNMLFIQNNDKPGLIGSVGTVLAEASINIAGITLGRVGKNDTAISLVNVDSEVPQEVIEKLRSTEHVLFRKIHLRSKHVKFPNRPSRCPSSSWPNNIACFVCGVEKICALDHATYLDRVSVFCGNSLFSPYDYSGRA